MSAAARGASRSVPTILKRRGGFGLDPARAPDPRRTERDLLDWLAADMPDVFPLPASPGSERALGREGADAAQEGRTVTLLLPRGRVAVLRIERRTDTLSPVVLDLLAACRKRRVPSEIVRSLAEARSALRRLGLEPERE